MELSHGKRGTAVFIHWLLPYAKIVAQETLFPVTLGKSFGREEGGEKPQKTPAMERYQHAQLPSKALGELRERPSGMGWTRTKQPLTGHALV